MKRRRLVAVTAAVALVAAGFVLPPSRLVVLGVIRGESFYRGWPTCYWHRDLARYRELWSPLSGDWYLIREPVAVEDWLARVLGRDVIPTRPPILDGDPAALPVLIELLQCPDYKTRRAAATGLGAIGPAAREATPALTEIARTTPDYALYVCACQALGSINADLVKPAGLDRPPRSLSFDLMP
ncbi:MAG TPA: HEAT repeat domain-containing protein [Gemmataceae bacterium]